MFTRILGEEGAKSRGLKRSGIAILAEQGLALEQFVSARAAVDVTKERVLPAELAPPAAPQIPAASGMAVLLANTNSYRHKDKSQIK